MRLTLVMILAVCLVAILAAGAMAGDYHVGSKLKCYQCHVMHATKSHVYVDENPVRDSWTQPTQGTGYDHLLKSDDVNELCMECHNDGKAKDVYGAAALTTINRIGGWFNKDAAGAYAPFASGYGHNLKNGLETPPGGAVQYDLDCGSCHEVHGNTYYRNIKDLGGGGISYASTTNDANKDVFQKLATGLKYDVSDVSYNLPTSGSHHYESFCVSCHTGIHSDATTGGQWQKHPTVGMSVSYTVGTVSPLKTLGGQPEAGGAGVLVAGDVSCVTCHKAHGSNHAFGLIFDNRTTVELEDSVTGSTDNVRVTCKHCHDKGLTDGAGNPAGE